MTISVENSLSVFLGNGATNPFVFSFIAGTASNVEVLYTDTAGTTLLLNPTQYTIFLNPPAVGQLWGIGGTVTYPKSGSPIANGTSITVKRIVPLTQLDAVDNQGDFYPIVVEHALDTLCLEIQQIAGRTGQFRGVWQTGVIYNYGDIVQDGVNGANTLNYYMAVLPHTSGIWADDLAAGDWALAFDSQGIIASTVAAAEAAAAAAAAAGAATAVAAAAQAVAAVLGVANSWKYSSVMVMADPGTGYLRLNNVPSLATQLAISSLSGDTGNPDLNAFLATWDDSVHTPRGVIRIEKNATNFAIVGINGSLTNNATWLQIPVVYIDGAGSFSQDDVLFLGFTTSGNDGFGTGDMIGANNLTELTNLPLARQNLGVEIGVDVQAENQNLDALSGLTGAADTLAYFIGVGSMLLTALTAFGRSLIGAASAAAARIVLGLGSSSIIDAGTGPFQVVVRDAFGNIPGAGGGAIAQSRYSSNANLTTITSHIPADDTIPQISEGVQIFSDSLAVSDPANKIRLSIHIAGTKNNSASNIVAALFMDGGVNAIASIGVTQGAADVYSPAIQMHLYHEFTPGDTLSHAFTIRVGSGAGTWVMNGKSAGRLYGGTMKATMILEEIGTGGGSSSDNTFIPQTSHSANYTTVLGDAGTELLHPSTDATPRTFTIDSNANVPYQMATPITFINQNGAGVLSIAIAGGDIMRLAGAGTTGTRTLAANGIATAVKIGSTEWLISGTGIT